MYVHIHTCFSQQLWWKQRAETPTVVCSWQFYWCNPVWCNPVYYYFNISCIHLSITIFQLLSFRQGDFSSAFHDIVESNLCLLKGVERLSLTSLGLRSNLWSNIDNILGTFPICSWAIRMDQCFFTDPSCSSPSRPHPTQHRTKKQPNSMIFIYM